MNNLYGSDVDDHLIFDALNDPLYQFSTGIYVPEAMGYTNVQPAYRLQLIRTIYSRESVDYRLSEETVIMEETFDHGQDSSNSYNNEPTYEENLELGERMGRVGSRLSEKTIMGHLKITSYDATSKRMDEEADMCVICQGDYEKGDFIGGLQCGHEYHVECVKKWLKQHNSCPICKAAAV